MTENAFLMGMAMMAMDINSNLSRDCRIVFLRKLLEFMEGPFEYSGSLQREWGEVVQAYLKNRKSE